MFLISFGKELYDIHNDLGEKNDVSKDHSEVVTHLRYKKL